MCILLWPCVNTIVILVWSIFSSMRCNIKPLSYVYRHIFVTRSCLAVKWCGSPSFSEKLKFVTFLCTFLVFDDQTVHKLLQWTAHQMPLSFFSGWHTKCLSVFFFFLISGRYFNKYDLLVLFSLQDNICLM